MKIGTDYDKNRFFFNANKLTKYRIKCRIKYRIKYRINNRIKNEKRMKNEYRNGNGKHRV